MKVTEIIKQNGNKKIYSIEIIPPKKGHSIEVLYKNIENLLDVPPAFINVTYHQREYLYKTLPNGLIEKIPIRKRPGTVSICTAIKYKYNIETIPHLICGGFSKQETEDALIDLHYVGIKNVFAIRGDAVKGEGDFVPHPEGHKYASELVEQIINMNKGVYLEELVENPKPTDFCVGVAGYPEKHPEAPNLDEDIKYLKKKIDLGAEYVITQMFFDNSKYFEFVKKCRKAGIKAPIIPGLKVLSSKRHLTLLPKIFHIDIPQELVSEIRKAKSKDAVKQIGIEWTITQVKELLNAGVPFIHFFTMGHTRNIKEIIKSIF